jgi:hypothetical protein
MAVRLRSSPFNKKLFEIRRVFLFLPPPTLLTIIYRKITPFVLKWMHPSIIGLQK